MNLKRTNGIRFRGAVKGKSRGELKRLLAATPSLSTQDWLRLRFGAKQIELIEMAAYIVDMPIGKYVVAALVRTARVDCTPHKPAFDVVCPDQEQPRPTCCDGSPILEIAEEGGQP
jgi:hypothetical protein